MREPVTCFSGPGWYRNALLVDIGDVIEITPAALQRDATPVLYNAERRRTRH